MNDNNISEDEIQLLEDCVNFVTSQKTVRTTRARESKVVTIKQLNNVCQNCDDANYCKECLLNGFIIMQYWKNKSHKDVTCLICDKAELEEDDKIGTT